MFKTQLVCEVLLAGPSDTTAEIALAEKIISEINDTLFHSDKYIKSLYWKKNTYMEASATPQSNVNDQILCRANVVIAFFKTRLGTKTEEFDSGTLEEIMKSIQKKRPVLIYLSEEMISQEKVDCPEYRRYKKFKDGILGKGPKCKFGKLSARKYSTQADLEQKLIQDIRLFLGNSENVTIKKSESNNFLRDKISPLITACCDMCYGFGEQVLVIDPPAEKGWQAEQLFYKKHLMNTLSVIYAERMSHLYSKT